ncbi:MAG: S8 family peptidase [Myxococcales bacterium]|nr:MAG: S8 family peptidase [Myxococcales bacterium]
MALLRGFIVSVLSVAWLGCGLSPSSIDQNAEAQSFDAKLAKAPAAYEAIDGEYVVVFNSQSGLYASFAHGNPINPDAPNQTLQVLDSFPSLSAILVRDASNGQSTLRSIATDTSVSYIQQNYKLDPWPIPQVVGAAKVIASPSFFDQIQQPAIWNLARIDQPDWDAENPNDAFIWSEGIFGYGVRAYVIDSGINPHPEFGCLDSFSEVCVNPGDDRIDEQNAYPDPGQVDTVGHGTHVAGTLGGVNYGVAKGVTLVPINVDVGGQPTVASMLAGMEHVLTVHSPEDFAVANISISGPKNVLIDAAVNNLIQAGIPVVVAAGNNEAPISCERSPANVPGALTVAASNIQDEAALFSNQGSCVDVFAPGVDILSAGRDGGTAILSGTSMASPHVAGSVALLLEGVRNMDGGSIDPEGVAAVVNCTATPDALLDVDSSTANRLLYMRNFGSAGILGYENLAEPPILSFAEPSPGAEVPNPVRISANYETCALGSIKLEELDAPNGQVQRTIAPTTGKPSEWVAVFEPGPVYLRATICDYFDHCVSEQTSFTALPAASTIYLPIVGR